jgi:hypothetical protein
LQVVTYVAISSPAHTAWVTVANLKCSDDLAGTGGYIGVDHTENLIVVSFKGSDNFDSFVTE